MAWCRGVPNISGERIFNKLLDDLRKPLEIVCSNDHGTVTVEQAKHKEAQQLLTGIGKNQLGVSMLAQAWTQPDIIAIKMACELVACCTELLQFKDSQEVPLLLAVLRRFSALPVDVTLLQQTGAGREVNAQWLRQHCDEAFRHESRAVMHQWKATVVPKLVAAQIEPKSAEATTPLIGAGCNGKDENAPTPKMNDDDMFAKQMGTWCETIGKTSE